MKYLSLMKLHNFIKLNLLKLGNNNVSQKNQKLFDQS